MPTRPTEFSVGGGGRPNPQAGSIMGEGKISDSHYSNIESLDMAWMNAINDMIVPAESLAVWSPYADYATSTPIDNISAASSGELQITTSSSHGLSDGDLVAIYGVGEGTGDGNTLADLNGQHYIVGYVDSTKFTLQGVPSGGWKTYDSGGWVVKLTPKTTYDPSTELTANQTEVSEYDSAVDALDALGGSGDVDSAFDLATTEADNIFTDDAIEDAVERYAQRLNMLYARRTSVMAAGMLDVGAINSTGYMMATAWLEAEKRRELAEYHAKLSLTYEDKRLNFISDVATKALAFKQFEVEQKRLVAHTQAEVNRLKVAAKTAETDVNRTIALKNHLWPLDRFTYGTNLLAGLYGGIKGAASDEDVISAGGGTIGEALSYAATGAAIGAKIGNAPGALIGAGLGALVSLFD